MENKLSRKELVNAYKQQADIGGIYMIKNNDDGKIFVDSTNNLHGSKSRFEFAQNTGLCLNKKLERLWDEIKDCHFTFEILEELKKKDTQSQKEFNEEIELLKEMWIEKLGDADFY